MTLTEPRFTPASVPAIRSLAVVATLAASSPSPLMSPLLPTTPNSPSALASPVPLRRMYRCDMVCPLPWKVAA